MKTTLLIVDDEPNVCYSLASTLKVDEMDIFTALSGKQGLALVVQHKPDVAIVDIRLQDSSGLDLVEEMHRLDPQMPIIVITAHGTTDTAIEAMKRGAIDYLMKPFELRNMRNSVTRALEVRRIATHASSASDYSPALSVDDAMIGRSSAMQEVYKAIGRVAKSNVNVLLLGESGVGKELASRAIFKHSRRSDHPFLPINCAAIPESLLESELFGHERGAFTGADKQRIGKFEQATGGTIFLDEIADMSSATQAKVLRVLQDQRFERVGGTETIQTDVRVIAATNQDLEQLVELGRFRRDLYYRLNVYSIRLPALRERLDDIPLLVDHFLNICKTETGKQITRVADETLFLLRRYLWPGNVRELHAVIKNSVVNASTGVLTPDCLPVNVREGAELTDKLAGADIDKFSVRNLTRNLLASGDANIYRQVIFAVDRVVLGEVLAAVHNNQVEAAARLGISRTTLRTKLQALELSRKEKTDSAGDN